MGRETFSSLKATHDCFRIATGYLYRRPVDVVTQRCPACGHELAWEELRPAEAVACPACKARVPVPGYVRLELERARIAHAPPVARQWEANWPEPASPEPVKEWPAVYQVAGALLLLMAILTFTILLIQLSR